MKQSDAATKPEPSRRSSDTLQSFRQGSRTAQEHELSQLDPWFHNIHLPNGVETAPHHPFGDFPAFKWEAIAPHLPADLKGWSVLDLGCNAGFYSFELAKRGAAVDAVDSDLHYLKQGSWAAKKLGLADRVTFRQKQVYELADEATSYDLVWFMGVFYHLRYPLLGLDILAQKTRQLMVFQSLSLGGEASSDLPENLLYEERHRLAAPDWPRMAFIEKRFAGDPTNWWVPGAATVEAMLRSSGFSSIRPIADETWLCQPAERNHPPPDYTALFGS